MKPERLQQIYGMLDNYSPTVAELRGGIVDLLEALRERTNAAGCHSAMLEVQLTRIAKLEDDLDSILGLHGV